MNMPTEHLDPIITIPFKTSTCPNCGRVFEPAVLSCPVCERPTRLESPIRDYVVKLGAP